MRAQGQGRPDQLPRVRRSVSFGRRRRGQVAMARLILRLAVAAAQPHGTALDQAFARFIEVLAQAVLMAL